MTWIRTGTSKTTDRWNPQDTERFRPHGGIGHIEWFNLDTGAGYLLATDGEWRTGGAFHLLWKASSATEAVDVSSLLWPIARNTAFPADPNAWSAVKTRVSDYVDRLLDAEDLTERVGH
ncbi:hypothetical protein [Yimella sp. NH-Cas1]|uniref:hypothetical protein n=1 Tax=Yimella sp. NH-Cas1 TaxID=2917726 RepID=UPI001EFBE885|nr:hypothetical protein [Yimella sp. NH-Cas1]MCG8656762.1 hypothetical protein [Yimella sp. NH-Cas1]